jgi:hypothetical protein
MTRLLAPVCTFAPRTALCGIAFALAVIRPRLLIAGD